VRRNVASANRWRKMFENTTYGVLIAILFPATRSIVQARRHAYDLAVDLQVAA
jgi:hypothetical protein